MRGHYLSYQPPFGHQWRPRNPIYSHNRRPRVPMPQHHTHSVGKAGFLREKRKTGAKISTFLSSRYKGAKARAVAKVRRAAAKKITGNAVAWIVRQHRKHQQH